MHPQNEAQILVGSLSKAVPYRIVEYSPERERELLSAFNHIFAAQRTLGHWKWKFLNNPYGSPTLSLAVDTQNRVVGHYAVIPLLMNCSGTPVLVGQSVDTFVEAQFRKYGLFVETAKHCYAQCLKKGIQAVFGFPNAAAYPGRVRKLEWKRIGFLNIFRFKLSLEDSLTKLLPFHVLAKSLNHFYGIYLELKLILQISLLKRQVPKATTLQKCSSVPPRYEDLWNRIKAFEVLSVWKDTQYLRWRYDQNPDQQYHYYSLTQNSQLVALAVVRSSPDITVICELFVLDREVKLARLLLLQIAKQHLASSSKNLVFKGHDCGFFSEAFTDFTQNLSFTDVLAGRVLKSCPLDPYFDLEKNWNIALGDSDGV